MKPDSMTATLAQSWKGLLWMGLLLVLLGMLILMAPVFASAATVLFLGIMLIVAGAAGTIYALMARHSGWAAKLLIGILSIVCGSLLVADPIEGMIGLTLLMAVFLTVTGVFRMVYGFKLKPHDGWGMVALNGAVNLALGIMIYAGWPQTGEYIIGLFLGIDAMFAGFSYVAVALVAKNMTT